jgi:hypothetical protein
VYVDEKTVNNDLFDLLASRKKFQRMPRVYSGAFNVKLAGVIDYGSFRDLQRHRPGFLNMPLLTNEVGFEAFYLDNMPTELKFEMFSLLDAFNTWYNFNSDDVSAVDKQYATPMGYKVNVQYSCDLNQALYICELRSGKTVHQTLRTLVHQWVKGLAEETAYGTRIHADMDVDNFTLKRGEQAGVAG